MKEFEDKVAVITGAAHGIGFGIAERCAQLGMKVVLAGINADNLAAAEEKLRSTDATVLSIRTDVSKREDVEALAQKTLDMFGAIHLVVNNAGVAAGSSVWESTWEEWEWVMNVNLWGVVNGVKIFTPLMLTQDTEAHIVNVASVAGLLPDHPCAPYQVTKHAVISLTENLYYSLAEQNSKVKVSVLCPGWVKTEILKAERNRPPELKNKPGSVADKRQRVESFREMQEAMDKGMTVEELTTHVFQAIEQDQLYILSHPDVTPYIQERMNNILLQKNPGLAK